MESFPLLSFHVNFQLNGTEVLSKHRLFLLTSLSLFFFVLSVFFFLFFAFLPLVSLLLYCRHDEKKFLLLRNSFHLSCSTASEHRNNMVFVKLFFREESQIHSSDTGIGLNVFRSFESEKK
jgi:hypothetical protein